MARTSHPFSSPFSKKEGEDRPRKAKQSRFFKPEPETSRFKLEKLWELPKKDITTIARNRDRASDESNFSVEVISDIEQILESEVLRVQWYLNEFGRYKALGYDAILRLPKGIDPENDGTVTNEDIRVAIQNEFSDNISFYNSYAEELEKTWRDMSSIILPVAATIYGFKPSGNYLLVPTAYGTGGGSLIRDGVVFMKLPKYRPLGRRTEVEAITHEILCHEATAQSREGTSIDESIFTSHQWHKERLMDLLGRTLLVRAGLMLREVVVMDDYAESQAAKDVDVLYYAKPDEPDENTLRYEGTLVKLIEAIEVKLKDVPVLGQ